MVLFAQLCRPSPKDRYVMLMSVNNIRCSQLIISNLSLIFSGLSETPTQEDWLIQVQSHYIYFYDIIIDNWRDYQVR